MPSRLQFLGRFLFSFTSIGYRFRGLPKHPSYPELNGRKIIITGATDGIGEAMAMAAAANGAHVYVIGRSDNKLEAAKVAAEDFTGKVTTLKTDLSVMKDVAELADTLAAEGPYDGLVNNVGILNHEYRESLEGRDMMYAVNILGQYILSEKLLSAGALVADATLLFMASGGLYNYAQNLRFMEQDAEGFDGVAAYAAHKRAQLVLSDTWSRAYPDQKFYTLHPGWVDTAGVRKSLPSFRKLLKSVLRQPEQGADTALWLLAQRPDNVSGKVWFDREPRTAHAFSDTRQPEASTADILEKLKTDAAVYLK